MILHNREIRDWKSATGWAHNLRFSPQQISVEKQDHRSVPRGAERAPSVDGESRGKRLGVPRRHYDDVALPPSCIKVLGALRIFAHPHSFGKKTQAGGEGPQNQKQEKWPGPGRKLGRGLAKYTTTTTTTTTTTAA